jgi:CBS domain-containing protein
MSKNFVIIYPDTTIQYLVDEHILGSGRRSFMVEKDGQLVGMLTLHGLQEVPKSEWPVKMVDQIMIPVSKVVTVGPDTELFEAIQEMDRDGVNQLPVLQAGQVLGVLTREDVISFLRRLQAGGRNLRPFS